MVRDSFPAICIIVENLSVPFDRRVWLEARALREAGYRVSVICPKSCSSQPSREMLEGIEIYRHWVWKAHGYFDYVFEYAFALGAEFLLALRVYAQTRFRILVACNPPDTIFLIALAFKLLGVRFVFDHHDLSPELYDAKFIRRGLMYKFVLLAEKLSFRFADLSLAVNESYREIAIVRGNRKPQGVVVVQNCADLREVRCPQPCPELKKGKRYMVLYVGVMGLQDGIRLLIESIGYLVMKKCRGDILFVLVGSGSDLAYTRNMVVRLGVEQFVEFTGYLPHEQVRSYLSTADVCVAPDPLNSLNDKSTMIKILEYMAYSRPVVLYDLKEGRRTAGEAALYARPNDPVDFAVQIEKLVESESKRRKMGECGRKRAEDGLNWETQSAKLLEAFDTLLHKRSRS